MQSSLAKADPSIVWAKCIFKRPKGAHFGHFLRARLPVWTDFFCIRSGYSRHKSRVSTIYKANVEDTTFQHYLHYTPLEGVDKYFTDVKKYFPMVHICLVTVWETCWTNFSHLPEKLVDGVCILLVWLRGEDVECAENNEVEGTPVLWGIMSFNSSEQTLKIFINKLGNLIAKLSEDPAGWNSLQFQFIQPPHTLHLNPHIYCINPMQRSAKT